MKQTDQITELAAALAKAQGEIVAAKRDSENPHFRSRYADLASVWDACRAALAKHGLAIVQSPRLVVTGETVWFVEVETRLLHESGQSLSDVLAMPLATPNAQGVGSACTYARRYALAAFVGVAPDDDDDANAATEPAPERDSSDRKPIAAPARAANLPPGALETVVITVKDIRQKPTANGGTKYTVITDDDKRFATFKRDVADLAKAAKETGAELEVVYGTSKYGNDIVALRDPNEPEPPL